MTTPRLLLIYKSAAMANLCQGWSREAGFDVDTAKTDSDAVEKCRATKPRVAALCLLRNNSNGLDLMRACLEVSPQTRFLLIAGSSAVGSVVEGMRAGAFDYLSAPVDTDRLKSAIETALSGGPLCPQQTPSPATSDLVCNSAAMRGVLARIKAVAPSKGTVFITGESGAGKGLCARTIHRTSQRANGPYVVLNCSGLYDPSRSEDTHKAQSTPTTRTQTEFEQAVTRANGGSLFIDKVFDLTPSMQTQLLRFLETSTIRSPDGNTDQPMDVRIICATHRTPQAEVDAGRFRADLFYRLFVLPIHVPPLRQRREDFVEIAESILARLSTEEGRQFTALSEEARSELLSHPWPGNVRQLINVLRQVVVLHDSSVLDVSMLPPEIVDTRGTTETTPPRNPICSLSPDSLQGRRMTEIERLVIEATLGAMAGQSPGQPRLWACRLPPFIASGKPGVSCAGPRHRRRVATAKVTAKVTGWATT